MKRVWAVILGGVLGLTLVGLSSGPGFGAKKQKAFPDIPRVTVKELQSMMGQKDVAILDVRPQEQWENSTKKIPGAIHEDPIQVSSWAEKYSKDETVIVAY